MLISKFFEQNIIILLEIQVNKGSLQVVRHEVIEVQVVRQEVQVVRQEVQEALEVMILQPRRQVQELIKILIVRVVTGLITILFEIVLITMLLETVLVTNLFDIQGVIMLQAR